MKRQGLLSATGILLLGLVVLMTLHEWDNSLPGEDQAVLTAPAILAHEINARAYSEETGELQYHLVADNLVQYDHNPLTEMTRPRLLMSNEQGQWTITSENGTVQQNGKLIVFTGQVETRNHQQKVELDTDELRFDSDTNIATSPGDAILRFESGETRAGSLEADLDKGVLSLDQGVESEFNAPAS
ncbi:MAG: LPS export ABC transporter periplasmic protein LptC [Alcanivorax nanhaiticus]